MVMGGCTATGIKLLTFNKKHKTSYANAMLSYADFTTSKLNLQEQDHTAHAILFRKSQVLQE